MKITVGCAVLAMMLVALSSCTVANADCIDAASVADGDVQRNAKLIASNKKLCISIDQVQENGLSWKFLVIKNMKANKGPTVFLLHDNEQAAFDTALYSVIEYGGQLVAVEAGENREFRGQDPNRNFALTADDAAPCRDMRTKPAPKFTKFMMDYHKQWGYYVLTLHNNADGHTGNGGSGAISAARVSPVMKGLPAPNGGDEDDAVLLAGKVPYEQNAEARKLTAYLHAEGVANVIYEHVRPEKNDCSFSNYIVLNTNYEYFNIEAQHGHGDSAKKNARYFVRPLSVER